MVMLAALTLPGIKAMQSASARSEALNTINAALQGVRSYAIMNNCKAAARFQPNGKIAFVYRYSNNEKKSSARQLDVDGTPLNSYPRQGYPNNEGYIYLPVIDQEPLKLPNGYAAGRLATGTNESLSPYFYEPFYICYNPDGTLAANEIIWVAMIENTTNLEPVNPDFDGNSTYTWEKLSSYSLDKWLEFTLNDPNSSDKDALKTTDINDRKLARYYYVAENAGDLKAIFDTGDVGIDHYAGFYHGSGSIPDTIESTSVSQFAIFKTPDNWRSLPLYDTSGADSKNQYVIDNLYLYSSSKTINPDLYETIFLNPYTGRMIRPME